MPERSTEQIRESLDSLCRVDSGRILETLIRLLGDFDLAEEAMHEDFITPPTLAQPIVRAKAKIRDTPIQVRGASPQELPERLDPVLALQSRFKRND